jgi:hypothetical protein
MKKDLLKILWTSTFAPLLLILQLATVSPALHAFLHGYQVRSHSSCDHCSTDDHGNEKSENHDQPHLCGIVLIAGGVTLTTGIEMLHIHLVSIGALVVKGPSLSPYLTSRRSAARAPPVL